MPSRDDVLKMTNDELDIFLSKIDRLLIKDNTKIEARSMSALEYIEGPHLISEENPLFSRIHKWFNTKYEKKFLQSKKYVGTSFVMIDKELYRVNYPVIYGLGIRISHWTQLLSYHDISEYTVNKMNKSGESEKFTEFLIYEYACFNTMNASAPKTVFTELENAVSCAVDLKSFGKAKYHISMAVEHMLKCFIKSISNKNVRGHNLKTLHAKCVNLGMPPIDNKFINIVQCDSKMRDRYEEININRKDLSFAYHHALEACRHICMELNVINNSKSN